MYHLIVMEAVTLPDEELIARITEAVIQRLIRDRMQIGRKMTWECGSCIKCRAASVACESAAEKGSVKPPKQPHKIKDLKR